MHNWVYTSLEVKSQLLFSPCLLMMEKSAVVEHAWITTIQSTGRRPLYWTMAEEKSCWWRRPCTSRWHLWRSTSTEMEKWKSLVAGLPWWGSRKGGAILTDLWPPMTLILSTACMAINSKVCFALLSLSPWCQLKHFSRNIRVIQAFTMDPWIYEIRDS